jgi:hypothetical protein
VVVHKRGQCYKISEQSQFCKHFSDFFDTLAEILSAKKSPQIEKSAPARKGVTYMYFAPRGDIKNYLEE